jgi:hypothetical protein
VKDVVNGNRLLSRSVGPPPLTSRCLITQQPKFSYNQPLSD